MTLIRIIAIFILIYLIFRFVTMYVLPWLLKWFIRRQQKKYYGERYSSSQGRERKKKQKEGDVNISYKQRKQISSDEMGEYIDYKEIKDKNSSKKKK